MLGVDKNYLWCWFGLALNRQPANQKVSDSSPTGTNLLYIEQMGA